MELRQLRYVLAVVDHGGFTRAAAAEHVAQPSLSQAIRTLERELGVELFHRLGRQVRLTPAGEALVGPARQVLRDLATIDAVVADVRGLRAGRLDLVALPTLAVEPLAGLLGRFRHLHPQVSVRVAEAEDLRDLTALVQHGHAELGLTELPPRDPTLRTHPMGSQEILAVRPPGTHRGSARRLAIGDLAGVPLVTTPPGTSTRELVEHALALAGIEPVVAVEVGHREALLPLVLAGAGTSFLPRPLAHQASRRGAVVLRLDPPIVRQIGLIHRPGPLAPAAHAFLALALEATTGARRTRSAADAPA
jgi:LysR family transcriptional regulator, carnitine catabolism transcriptional activator